MTWRDKTRPQKGRKMTNQADMTICEGLLSTLLSKTLVSDACQRLRLIDDCRGTRDDEPTGHDKT